jgi:YaiO family outer membrane protein
MKTKWFPIIAGITLACASALAQENVTAIPQGMSIPGISAITNNLNGPGYIEAGGSHSGLTNDNPAWNDGYLKAVISGGSNTFSGEATRQDRYGDAGWYLGAGVSHVFNPNWYTDFFAGTSTRCFFLPKMRLDGFVNRKLLSRKQLVATLGAGYDRYKDIHSAYRLNTGAMYYFSRPLIIQGGMTFTQSNPGAILTRSQYVAVTEGHYKEHYIIGRGEFGREGYQLIGPASALFNFPYSDLSLAWRQWVGLNWGMQFGAEHYQSPYWIRNGATVGFFLEF